MNKRSSLYKTLAFGGQYSIQLRYALFTQRAFCNESVDSIGLPGLSTVLCAMPGFLLSPGVSRPVR